MNILPDIEKFVAQLEIYAKQKLIYPAEVASILQLAIQLERTDEFEELCFQAKFLTKTNDIMKRIGPGTDGFEKLSAEFQTGMQKAKNTLISLIHSSPADWNAMMTESFINMQTESFHRFVNLLADLSWIKNWQVDGNPLPYQKKTPGTTSLKEGRVEKTSAPLVQIERSAFMALILLILFLFIDLPVTLFGWMLSLGIAVFLVYIILQVYIVIRISKS